jgi:hypothetical protein
MPAGSPFALLELKSAAKEVDAKTREDAMSFLRQQDPGLKTREQEENQHGVLTVELINGSRYEIHSETWEEDEDYFTFETEGELVAKIAKSQVLMLSNGDDGDVKRLQA